MRVAILSDIHGNIEALNAVEKSLHRIEEIIVLGDLVDYGPSPETVIDTVRDLGAKVIRGNHDHAVAYNTDCKCGEATKWLSVWTRENISLKTLSKNDISFLKSLPLTYSICEWSFYHASPKDPMYDYMYPWTPLETLRSVFTNSKVNPPKRIGIGHTHVQFYLTLDGHIIINPGSVGQPRDGDNRASYAIIDCDQEKIDFRRIKYNVEKTIKDLLKYNPPKPVLEALAYILREGKTPPPSLRKAYIKRL